MVAFRSAKEWKQRTELPWPSSPMRAFCLKPDAVRHRINAAHNLRRHDPTQPRLGHLGEGHIEYHYNTSRREALPTLWRLVVAPSPSSREFPLILKVSLGGLIACERAGMGGIRGLSYWEGG